MLSALIFIDGNADPFNAFEPPAPAAGCAGEPGTQVRTQGKPMRDLLRHRRDMPARKTIARALDKRG